MNNHRPEYPECSKTRFTAHDLGCPFDADWDAPNRQKAAR